MGAKTLWEHRTSLEFPKSTSLIVRCLPIIRTGAIYLVPVTIIIYIAFSNWAYDDPFITYRYADNLQRGLGFVYNPGERVLSTTTPLFTILLALLTNLWSDMPHLANLIGTLSLASGALALWDMAHTWRMPLVGWVALLLYPTFPLLLTPLGSETPLYLALCLGAFALYARRHYALTALVVALAILTRPDGILVGVVLAIDYFVHVRRPIPWVAILVFLGVVLPWFVFAWLYFGSPLPATLMVKQQQGIMSVSQQFAPGLLTVAAGYAKWQYVPDWLLALLGLLTVWRYSRHWFPFLSWPVLYALSYSLLGVSRYYWYYAPLVPGFLVLIGLGISGVSAFVRKRGLERNRVMPSLVASLILVLFIFQIGDVWQLRQQPEKRIRIYTAVGYWLRDNTPADASVGTLEIGMIGYYARRRMVDFAGLIEPRVAAQINRDTTYEDMAIWAIEHYHPTFVVLHRKMFPRLERGYVSNHCWLMDSFSGEDYGFPSDLDILECDDSLKG